MRPSVPAIAALALLLAPAPAPAHEALHEVQRGRALAVRAWHADGDPVAGAAFQVFSPADPRAPWQEGRTDRAGWLAFVPDSPGTWRVRILDRGGHGLDLKVDAGTAATTAPAAGPAPDPAPSPAPAAGAPAGAGRAAFLLRPLVGLVVIGAVFAALFLAYRRKDAGR